MAKAIPIGRGDEKFSLWFQHRQIKTIKYIFKKRKKAKPFWDSNVPNEVNCNSLASLSWKGNSYLKRVCLSVQLILRTEKKGERIMKIFFFYLRFRSIINFFSLVLLCNTERDIEEILTLKLISGICYQISNVLI